MYARWIELYLGPDCQVKVFVGGTPSMTDAEFRARALQKIRAEIQKLYGDETD